VVQALATQKKELVYMLWGSYAQKKAAIVNSNNNLVLKSSHPSPLSAPRGFFGNELFSRANEYLKKNYLKEIEW